MLSLLLAAFVLGHGGTHRSGPPAPCVVQGVWTLESVTADGKVEPVGKRRHLKVVGATHYAWVSQEPGPAALRSMTDSVAAFRTSGFGGGTYRVTDSTYTEKLEYFYDPAYIGQELTAVCRIAANRWTHTFQFPVLENGRETRRVRVEEVWRRVQ